MRFTSWPAVLAIAVTAGFAPAATAAAGTSAPGAGPLAHAGTVTNDGFILNNVSADSSSDAWAVGNGNKVLHWNGTSWTPVALPRSKFNYGLNAVDALSASDVWAVGTQGEASPDVSRTLIMHWDGTSWERVPSPGPSNTTLIPSLNYLGMDSATDGWATGSVYDRQTGTNTNLAAHWNGTSWTRVTLNSAFFLNGVVAVSPTDATAVGEDKTGGTFMPAAFKWNGTSWALSTLLPLPSGVTATSGFALGLSADSATDMWAIGGYDSASGGGNLAWHWDGTSWTAVPVPVPVAGGLLEVAAVSPSDVWAVGYVDTRKGQKAVSAHWDGTSWTQVATPATPNPQGRKLEVVLNDVAAGPGTVWAVGNYSIGPQGSDPRTWILSWNGTRWIRS